MEVRFVHPLKQLLSKVFPAAVLKETEGKFLHPLKQLAPIDQVALLRFRDVNPVHPVKLPFPSLAKALDVVIWVMPEQFLKHS